MLKLNMNICLILQKPLPDFSEYINAKGLIILNPRTSVINSVFKKIYFVQVIEVGIFTHTCEDDIVCNTTCGKIPYFNAPIYFDNKEQLGKVDEIFGGPKNNVSSFFLQ